MGNGFWLAGCSSLELSFVPPRIGGTFFELTWIDCIMNGNYCHLASMIHTFVVTWHCAGSRSGFEACFYCSIGLCSKDVKGSAQHYNCDVYLYSVRFIISPTIRLHALYFPEAQLSGQVLTRRCPVFVVTIEFLCWQLSTGVPGPPTANNMLGQRIRLEKCHQAGIFCLPICGHFWTDCDCTMNWNGQACWCDSFCRTHWEWLCNAGSFLPQGLPWFTPHSDTNCSTIITDYRMHI